MADSNMDDFKAGLKSPGVETGPIDPLKTRASKKAMGASGGFGRSAGMLIDDLGISQQSAYESGHNLDTYRTSYANAFNQGAGVYDIPQYFAHMNENNGGLFYWPVTPAERHSWYRYFANTDAFIGRAMELLTDLPMSKFKLTMPEMPKGKQKLREEILEFFDWQCKEISLFAHLQSSLWEVNLHGQSTAFHEWSTEKKMWERAVILPPEEVISWQIPFTDERRIEYRPKRIIELIQQNINDFHSGLDEEDEIKKLIVENVPKEIKKMIEEKGCIVMDSDPSTGSFAYTLSRRRSPYLDYGASVCQRVLVPMLQKEHFRYTQLSLASRNMTPKNMVSAEGLLEEELQDLRTQIDLSYLDPDYTIVTNYPVSWEQIGAQDRLLDLDREYERIENHIFAAFGLTRSIITGEGFFSGDKITVEILNTMFLQAREQLTEYVEEQLFQPVAEAHGWFEERANGVKKYYYPKLSFNRLTIRDNRDVFDSLYQLYQKGSLPVDTILELFNLDPNEINEKLEEDLFTVKDSTFNRMVEEANSEVGRAIAEKTNLVEKVAKGLGLKITQEGGEEGEGGFDEGGYDDFGSFGEPAKEEPAKEEPVAEEPAKEDDTSADSGGVDVDAISDAVSDAVPAGASEDEIKEIVDQL